jgi:ribonuclease P protein component
MKNITTIKLNKEFKRAYFQGKYKPHPLLVTYLVKNRLGINRVGITTSKKIGKAVERNRARRVIRAAYLQIRDQIDFPCGYDLVFVARSKTAETKSTELEKVMLKQLRFLLSQNQQKTKQKKAVYPKKDEAK